MTMKANFDELLKQAQGMQEQMQKAQQELVELEVTGEAGGGLVKIIMNGRYDVKKVAIDRSLIMDEDKEMIEDLVASAINDAVQKIEKTSREKISSLASGIKVPKDISELFGGDKDK
jgi:DNA-binding YbaB/EbfC family protein